MFVALSRVVNNRERYYHISIFITLFGDFCIERRYGAVKNKKPTKVIKEYYNSLIEAKKHYQKLFNAKISKGYKVTKTFNKI